MSKQVKLNAARVIVTSGMVRSLMQANRLPEKARFEIKQQENKLLFSVVAPVWLKGDKLKKYLKKKTDVLNRAIVRLGIWLAKAFSELRKYKPAYRLDFHYDQATFENKGYIRKKILTLSIP
jgi:hypothetical protein